MNSEITKKKSIKRNYVYNMGYQILLLITPLITTPYVSRVLGADGIGTVSYAESVVSYFSLFATMGITTHGQREVSYVQNSRENRNAVFWNSVILKFITSFFVLLIYLIFASFQDNSIVYYVLCCNIIAVAFDITWFFQGLEEFEKIIFRNVIFKIVSIIYIFATVKNKEDLVLYVIGLAIFTFLSNLSLWACLSQYIEKPHLKLLHPFKDFKIVLSLFIPTIAIQIYTVMDKTMIGLITKDPFENGYYEQALKMSKMVLTIVTSLGTVMIPRIGYYFKNGESNMVRTLMYRGYKFVWFLGIPLCFGLFMISDNFVPWFFGTGYEKVSLLLKILSFLILAIGINNVTGMQYLLPTMRQNLFTLTVMIGAITNFCLNFILIYFFQSIGAAIASVLAESIIAIVQLIFTRNELSLKYIILESKNYVIAGITMVVVLKLLDYVFVSEIIYTIIMLFSGATTYFVILFIIKDTFFISNVQDILQKIIKKVKGVNNNA